MAVFRMNFRMIAHSIDPLQLFHEQQTQIYLVRYICIMCQKQKAQPKFICRFECCMRKTENGIELSNLFAGNVND